jgi:NAD(P)-dependent dehydrogenase (short-subunit alcohol dehydrogenase family)
LNPLSMTGRTVLVTGASSGIGRETAILLSRLEGNLVIVGRDRSRLEETRALAEGACPRVEVFDLNNTDEIPAWMKRISRETGPFYGLVHCAGIQQTVPLRSISSAGIDDLFRTNVTSAMMLVRGFRQKECSVRGGSVVLISSIAGLVGQPAIGPYSASKAALTGFARSAAIELAPEGLRVNCIAPGYVKTEMAAAFRERLTAEQFDAIVKMHPLGLGEALDVAQAAAFLLADTGRWITGTTLVVDGGYTIR